MFRFGDPGGRMYQVAGTGNVNILANWNAVNGNGWSVVAGQGRSGGTCLRYNSGGGNAVLSKGLPDNQATLGCAFAFRCANVTAAQSGNGNYIMNFNDAGYSQIKLCLDNTGALRVLNGSNTVLSTIPGAVTNNVWVHIEVKVTFHGTLGVVTLWLNGVQKINLTGVNTSYSGNNWANTFQIGDGWGFGVNLDWDDVILYDGQTTDANGNPDITGPVGDCNLVWLLPTGAGTTTQWTPDSGSNYARVNEATPDGDTSYVISQTVGQIDTYVLADLPGSIVTVKSLATAHYARKDDVGTRAFKSELRSAGGNAVHPTPISPLTSYQYWLSTWGQNPNNGSPIPWTPATVNALEAGQNLSS